MTQIPHTSDYPECDGKCDPEVAARRYDLQTKRLAAGLAEHSPCIRLHCLDALLIANDDNKEGG